MRKGARDGLDATLLTGLRQGDEAGLAAFMDAYGGYIHAILHRVAGGVASREDLEDAAAECVVSIWKNAEAIRPDGLKAYVAAAARNRAIDLRTRRARDGHFLPLTEDILDAGMAVDDALIQAAARSTVQAALLAFGEPDRTIFIRRYYYGDAVRDIATALSLGERAVEGRLYRGRARLKASLGGMMDEG